MGDLLAGGGNIHKQKAFFEDKVRRTLNALAFDLEEVVSKHGLEVFSRIWWGKGEGKLSAKIRITIQPEVELEEEKDNVLSG